MTKVILMQGLSVTTGVLVDSAHQYTTPEWSGQVKSTKVLTRTPQWAFNRERERRVKS